MAKKIQWSLHRDDRKIGSEEVLDDELLAQRYVDTGMATFVDEPADAPVDDQRPAPTDAGKVDDTAKADGPNELSKPDQTADAKPATAPAAAKPKAAGS